MTLLEKSEKTGRLTEREFEEVVRLTQHPDVLVSGKAYCALWFVKEPNQQKRAAELFRKAIDHPDPFVRSAACKGIGFVGTASDIPLLLPRLRDSDEVVRAITLQSLYTLGGPNLKDHVRPLLQDPDPDVRKEAEKILQKWESQPAKGR